MATVSFKLTGVTPIILHSEQLADPTNPITKQLKALTGKRKKTDEDLEEIKWVEWFGGLYLDDKGKVVVPGQNVHKCLVEGARKFKEGKLIEQGVLETAPFFPLEYDGPKDHAKLKGNRRFCSYRTVVVNGKRCMRARPIFQDWSLTVSFTVDTDVLNPDRVEAAMILAGERIGLGDNRPRFGRFIAERVN